MTMEFRPLTRTANGLPKLSAKTTSTTLSIPPNWSGRAKLEDGAVQLGLAEDKGKRYLQVINDPAGEYKLARRGQNLVLTTPALLPTTPNEKQRAGVFVEVHSFETGLVIELPRDWKLQNSQ